MTGFNSDLSSIKVQWYLKEIENNSTLESNSQRRMSHQDKVANNVLWKLFANCRAAPGDEDIAITGYVMPDGKGDWFNMLKTSKLLQKKFPNRKIRLIVLAAENHRDKLEAPQVKHLDLAFDNKADSRFFSEDSQILQKVKDAGAVIVGPVDIPRLYDPLKRELAQKGMALTEYDLDTNRDTLCTKRVPMGLSKNAIGIFTQSLKQYTWQDVNNERLKEILFHTEDPSKDVIEKYLSNNTMFLCYMHPMKAAGFIEDTAAFAYENEETKTKSIDICFPSKGNFTMFRQKRLDSDYITTIGLENYGIGKVTFITFENGQRIDKSFEVADEGKEIRVIDVGQLTGKDFKILTQISAPLVGCTGDISLGLVLSYGKIPLHEVKHKTDLSRNLKKIVEENIGKDSALLAYIEGTNISPWANAPDLVQSQEIVEQAKHLGKIIREHFSANAILQGMVNERLMRRAYPDFAAKMDSLRWQYQSLEITIDELEYEVAQELQRHELAG